MPEFEKRSEVTVSTMGKVHNPNGDGIPAVSSSVSAAKKKAAALSTQLSSSSSSSTSNNNPTASTTNAITTSPAHRETIPNTHNNKHELNTKNLHETKVKEEGSARRNITRKKSDGKEAGGHYNSRNKKHGGAGKGMWVESLDGSDQAPIMKLDENDPLYDDFGENVDGTYVLVSSSDNKGENGTNMNGDTGIGGIGGGNNNGAADSIGMRRPTGYDPVAKKAVYGPMLTLSEFKIRVTEALQEYFDSEDYTEFITCVSELKCVQYHSEIVKKAVSLSLDKSSREKELISRLLSILHPHLLSDENMADGFDLVLDSLDDLCIDAPDAKTIVGTFLARAVMDEVLPPAFLSSGNHPEPEVVERAVRLLSREHCGVRLEHVWGPGDGRSVEELKIVMDQLLKEYLLSRELDEAARCIREMNSPHFHHELVKRGFTTAIDELRTTTTATSNKNKNKNTDHDSNTNNDNNNNQSSNTNTNTSSSTSTTTTEHLDAMAALFHFLVENAIVSEFQVSKGMKRLQTTYIEDLKLDVSPKAPELLVEFEDMLIHSGTWKRTTPEMIGDGGDVSGEGGGGGGDNKEVVVEEKK